MTKPHASKETIQRLIVAKVVEGLLNESAQGCELIVETGDKEPLLKLSDDPGEIMAAIFSSTSEEVWLFCDDRHSRWVKLVMDNDVDIISDYHVELGGALAKANALAIALEG